VAAAADDGCGGCGGHGPCPSGWFSGVSLPHCIPSQRDAPGRWRRPAPCRGRSPLPAVVRPMATVVMRRDLARRRHASRPGRQARRENDRPERRHEDRRALEEAGWPGVRRRYLEGDEGRPEEEPADHGIGRPAAPPRDADEARGEHEGAEREGGEGQAIAEEMEPAGRDEAVEEQAQRDDALQERRPEGGGATREGRAQAARNRPMSRPKTMKSARWTPPPGPRPRALTAWRHAS